MAKPILLFVCTGNVCRSPIAEHLLRARLGPESNWEVHSAGLAAFPGMGPSAAAIQVMNSRGIDIAGHASRPLDRGLVDAASLIVVMTASHLDEMRERFPDAIEKVLLLKSFDPATETTDIEDPMGSSVDTYRRVCEQIDRALPGLTAFMSALETSPLNGDEQPTR